LHANGGGPEAGQAEGRRVALLHYALLLAVFAVGLWWRLRLLGEDLFADELATWWDVIAPESVADVVRLVSSDAEITPPLYFVLARVATWFGRTEEMLRLPSLLAGSALIPLVYAWGRFVAGRWVGLTAAAITAFAPFQLYYSAEARAYAVMTLLVAVSTLSLLAALRQRKLYWWALYVLASAGAMYTHYTAVFVLAVQLMWALVVFAALRRPLVAANVCAALLFAPWIPSFLADRDSWTTQVLSGLTPLDLESLGRYWIHWSFGYPYAANGVAVIPGWPAVAALGLGLAAGGWGAFRRVRRRVDLRSPVALTVMLAFANPILALAVSLVSSNVYGPRNLAASWPALAVTLALVAWSALPRWRVLSVGGVVGCFAIGGAITALGDHGRPQVSPLLALVDKKAQPRDVLVDGTARLSPGPVSIVDAIPHASLFTVRVGAPAVRDRPFRVGDVRITASELSERLARDLPRGSRVFWLTLVFQVDPSWLRGDVSTPERLSRIWRRAGFRIVERHESEAGFVPVRLWVLERSSASPVVRD
jgi:hypothetical protein